MAAAPIDWLAFARRWWPSFRTGSDHAFTTDWAYPSSRTGRFFSRILAGSSFRATAVAAARGMPSIRHTAPNRKTLAARASPARVVARSTAGTNVAAGRSTPDFVSHNVRHDGPISDSWPFPAM